MRLQFTKRQWLTVVVISIADFCNAICVALQAPFFPHEVSVTLYNLTILINIDLARYCINKIF